jgi:ABC-type multidrug transport system fused ATPase/permease subunit
MSIVKRYISLCDKDVKFTALGLICGCTGSYFSVYASEHTSRLMQGDFSNERLLKLLYANILAMITTSIRGTCFAYSQKCMNVRLKKIIYNKLINQRSKYYQITPVSSLLEYINNDVRTVSELISLNINVMSRSSIHVIATMWLLTNISWKLTGIACILIPLNLLISNIYEKLDKYYMNGIDDLNKEINAYSHETLSHVSVIKTYANEDNCNTNFYKLHEKVKKYDKKNSLLYGINLLFISNIPTFTTIAIILAARYLDTMNGLITFILHNQSLYENVKAIIHFKNEFIKCREPYKRVIDMLDSDEYKGGYYIPPKNEIEGTISFNNIKFKYEKSDTYILDNFNFKINSGDKIAIIGESGSGKSTLVKTITGILSPESGTILVDDVDIETYDNKWIKSKIGYVAQDSILFSDTIANNIAYGYDNATREEIEYAAKQANAHDFIMKLPENYETKIDGTELSSLSGGQKQRISIARALIRKPKILIFDEATSALDPKCEEIVQNTIRACLNNKNITIIIIAHRKSALELADKVYKFENSELILT